MNQRNVVDLRNVQVRTATVEVKHITISDRKLTQTVFRQVQEEDIIDFENAIYKGIPWGHVNYFWGSWKGSRATETTKHILWQKADELRRCVINGTRYFDNYEEAYTKFVEDPFTLSFSDKSDQIKEDTIILTLQVENKIEKLLETYATYPPIAVLPLRDFQTKMSHVLKVWEEKNIRNNWYKYMGSSFNTFSDFFWAELKRVYSEEIQKYSTGAKEIIIPAAKIAYQIYVNNHLKPCSDLLRRLHDLDQMYIAV